MKRLVEKRNQYERPGSPRPGPWGQLLVFDDGSTEFDAGHAQQATIIVATRAATGQPVATFVAGAVGKDEAGNWVPAKST